MFLHISILVTFWAAFALCLERATSLSPHAALSRSVKSAQSTSRPSQLQDEETMFAASVLAAAYIFANTVAVVPAFAAQEHFTGSTQVVAVKSGGRMGGRSAVGSRRASPSYANPTSSSTTRVDRTTIIQQPAIVQPPVVIAPPLYGGYGYGYGVDPVAVGLSVGLSAMNSIGREMREQSQESEISRERAELQEAKIKQIELESRLRALEAAHR